MDDFNFESISKSVQSVAAKRADCDHRLFDFELNHQTSLNNCRHILYAIIEYLSSRKRLHEFDAKLAQTPLKNLTLAVRADLARTDYSNSTDLLLSQAAVEEVFTLGNTNHRRPVLNEGTNLQALLFFSKTHQRKYKRVTVSCHLPYLLLNNVEDDDVGMVDRSVVSDLASFTKIDNAKRCLLKASTSVLLSLVLPEESPLQREETRLLQDPQCLWTVLVINAGGQLALDAEPSERLAPISQYFRGVTACLINQRRNGEAILGFLKRHLTASMANDLLDDEELTNTRLYHQSITTCHELDESISLNVKFSQRLSQGQFSRLVSTAHAREGAGIAFWRHAVADEVQRLDELRLQVEGVSKMAKERRDAMHSTIAVLEAREAAKQARESVKQSERMTVLTYLAVAYLPLTCTSSIYSMSVLPDAASLPSAVVVFIIFLLLTAVGLTLSKHLRMIQQGSATVLSHVRRLISGSRGHIRHRVRVLESNTKEDKPSELLKKVSEQISFDTILQFCLNEINLPVRLWYTYRDRDHLIFGSTRMSSLESMVCTARLTMIPVWILIGIVGIILDIIWLILWSLLKFGWFILSTMGVSSWGLVGALRSLWS
ncbi:MAG: hypothetical protein Q9159_002226 [Coniocarpon cinnabarinum]